MSPKGIICTPRYALPQGSTLVNILVTLVILAIAAHFAVPSFKTLLRQQRLKAAAEGLNADLQFIRSEALKRRTTLYFGRQTGANWCYSLSDNSSCNCSTAATSCTTGQLNKIVSSSNFNNISLTSSYFTANPVTFNGILGVANGTGGQGTITFSSQGSSISLVLNNSGYTLLCSATIIGYSACP